MYTVTNTDAVTLKLPKAALSEHSLPTLRWLVLRGVWALCTPLKPQAAAARQYLGPYTLIKKILRREMGVSCGNQSMHAVKPQLWDAISFSSFLLHLIKN
jgi:hypothetical protein